MVWIAVAVLLVDIGVQGLRAARRMVDWMNEDRCTWDPEHRRWMQHWQCNLDRLEHGEDWIPYRTRYPKDDA